MIATIKLEWCMTGAGIFYIIISKFSHLVELDQIIQFNIDETSKISLHYTILPFSLTISLWLENG